MKHIDDMPLSKLTSYIESLSQKELLKLSWTKKDNCNSILSASLSAKYAIKIELKARTMTNNYLIIRRSDSAISLKDFGIFSKKLLIKKLHLLDQSNISWMDI